ncbi:DUF1471 domain-containing protein [Budviciaceae bacterium BWR-B9]|uniref:DUF1471 domain-containing protein n=1 Tax=Limnobaculum allomyrinae TaxID=2791986 RepID=A0ABS1ITS5_9GAMM|nr:MULTISPECIES: YdgH/BhsA/McbA-like domain containing protein [Limnobaculum]MBK5144957.1 DUF1471 domain-containing protein [Limnobaculum allomyrinae]MBV7692788.1 DUF1471 domain-containing protein [Limnobaculum sp. M2-1]
MKVSTTLAALLLTFSVGSAYAATEVNSQQAASLQSMGTISGSVRVADMDQAVSAIAKKAESQHASYYRVIAANSNDDSNNWRVAAEIYR